MVKPKPDDADTRRQRSLAALAHPTRRRILDYMQAHERVSPRELADALGVPLGNVSYHVRRLRGLDAIKLVGQTARRGATEHHYRLVTDADAEHVIAQLAGRFFNPPDAANLGTRALLDAHAVGELRRELEQLFTRLRDLEAQSIARTAPMASSSPFPVHVACVIDAPAKTPR